MNCREYNFGNWTFGTSDFADLPGGKPVYPVEVELTRSEYENIKNILKKEEHAARVRFDSEKNTTKQVPILERLNGICACLMAMEQYNGSYIELEEESELDTLIVCVRKAKGKTVAQLVKRLEILRG